MKTEDILRYEEELSQSVNGLSSPKDLCVHRIGATPLSRQAKPEGIDPNEIAKDSRGASSDDAKEGHLRNL